MHRRRTDPGPAEPVSYWLRGERRPADPPLLGAIAADVVVIGAGFTGLWTALALTETDPAIDVVMVEAETVAYGASGRNGGFCEASLTHGLANGIRHFRDELDRLEAEGLANLRALVDFTLEHGIACDLEETGTLSLADQPYQVDEFRAWVDEAAAYGEHLEFMDRTAAQAGVHSPTWRAALYRPPGRDAMLDPDALCRGLARVARERGIRIFEGSPAERLDRVAGGRRPATFAKLEAQFVHAFPQLEGLRFPYRWGGAIDTTTRFTVTFGQTMGGRVTYALGYTGLGVGASRWAGGVVRDFILRPDEDRLGLRIVQRAPIPFPPEPFRSPAVNAVRHDLDRADREAGRRSMLLRTLDALGIGFDS